MLHSIQPIKANRVFLFFGIIFGIIFLFITPPFQVADEFLHFQRAYLISTAGWVKVRKSGHYSTLPKSIQTTENAYQSLLFHPEIKTNIRQTLDLLTLPLESTRLRLFSMGPFLPTPYIPAAMVIFLGRVLELSPLILMYLGRLSNLAIWLVLMSKAIKSTPIFKWVFCLLALMPMSLFLGASLSYDSLTNGICFLFTATILKFAYSDKSQLNRKELLTLIGLSLLLPFFKHIYILLILLYLLIPVRKIGSKKKYFSLFFTLLISNIAVLAAWFLRREGTRPRGISEMIGESFLSIFLQASRYGKLLFLTIETNARGWIQQFIGGLGWDAPIPMWGIWFYTSALIIVSLYDKEKSAIIHSVQKLLLVFIILSTYTMIATVMYISTTPIVDSNIPGIQGRYFIPLSPLLFLIFYNQKLQPAMGEKGVQRIALFAIIPTLFLSIWTLLKRYYY